MATYKELNKIYLQTYNQELPRATLSKWVKKQEIKAEKESNGKYNYDLESFKTKAFSDSVSKQIRAKKENPKDYIGKICGKLLVTGIVPKEEYETNYQGTLMYCDCLNCGKKHIQVRFSYLTPNGNYQQETCGCGRKIYAFIASSGIKNLDPEWLMTFDNFSKFLFIHKALLKTSSINFNKISLQKYKNMIQYFYNDKQFNAIYSFWEKHKNKNQTFYDWAKPSLDHIIPKSKGGSDEDISNFQFLTVFENLAKRDMTQAEWNEFKQKTHTSSDYFIENILKEQHK